MRYGPENGAPDRSYGGGGEQACEPPGRGEDGEQDTVQQPEPAAGQCAGTGRFGHRPTTQYSLHEAYVFADDADSLNGKLVV